MLVPAAHGSGPAVTFREWARDTGRRLRSDGLAGASASLRELYVGGLRRVNAVYPRGTNVFERNWDVLVVLDACRVDLMESVADEYAFLNDPGTLTSVGSSSIQWLEETFTDEYRSALSGTAYVTGNPFSHRVLGDGRLSYLDQVWQYAWDEELGTIPARPLTDRAIHVARNRSPDRLIVHYMQPHFPSVPTPLSDGMNRETLGEGAGWESPWKRLQRGELSREAVWDAYRANLRYVLEDVSLLRENLNADRLVITADHGNASGRLGVYGHPKVPLAPIREVPWYTTDATDRETYEPDRTRDHQQSDVEQKLSALGYK